MNSVINPGYDYFTNKLNEQLEDQNNYRVNFDLVQLIIFLVVLGMYIVFVWIPYCHHKNASVRCFYGDCVVSENEVVAGPCSTKHCDADEGVPEAVLQSAVRQRRLIMHFISSSNNS